MFSSLVIYVESYAMFESQNVAFHNIDEQVIGIPDCEMIQFFVFIKLFPQNFLFFRLDRLLYPQKGFDKFEI